MNTFEEIKNFDLSQIETRVSEIRSLMNDENADIDALIEETDMLIERKNSIMESNKKFSELRSRIAASSDSVIEEHKSIFKEDNKKMDIKELRNSQKYVDAYAEYIKSGDDKECRRILTELADYSYGQTNRVPVPNAIVEPIVRHAYEQHKLLDLVNRTEVQGVLKIAVEISGDEAHVHDEGDSPVSEENLVLKVVSIQPKFLKKWLSVSDEVLSMTGERFLTYVYEEISNKIFQKVEDLIVSSIVYNTDGLVTTLEPTFTAIDFIRAVSTLSSSTVRNTIVMNKASYAYYKQIQMNAGYSIDVFDGMDIVFNNSLTAVTDSEVTGPIAIVGDFSNGMTCNFPDGMNVNFKVDDVTLATSDLVRIIGKMQVGVAVTNAGHFTVLMAE